MTGNQNGQDIKAYLLEKHRQGQISQTLCDAITALCDAAQKIAQIAAQNGIGAASLGALTGAENTDGDEQKALDVMADELISAALAPTGIAAYLSEERNDAVVFSDTKGLQAGLQQPLHPGCL